jgi:hypothetical protein
MYKRNTEERSRHQTCHRKSIGIPYSECVSVALLMKHSRLTPRIILSSVACLAVPYFSTLFHTQHDFRGEKFIDIKVRVLIFSTTFVSKTFFPRRNETDITINVRRSSR